MAHRATHFRAEWATMIKAQGPQTVAEPLRCTGSPAGSWLAPRRMSSASIDSVSGRWDGAKASWLWIFADPVWQSVVGRSTSTLMAYLTVK